MITMITLEYQPPNADIIGRRTADNQLAPSKRPDNQHGQIEGAQE